MSIVIFRTVIPSWRFCPPVELYISLSDPYSSEYLVMCAHLPVSYLNLLGLMEIYSCRFSAPQFCPDSAAPEIPNCGLGGEITVVLESLHSCVLTLVPANKQSTTFAEIMLPNICFRIDISEGIHSSSLSASTNLQTLITGWHSTKSELQHLTHTTTQTYYFTYSILSNLHALLYNFLSSVRK